MDGKKVAIGVVLVIVIAGAAMSIMKRSGGGTAKPPDWVLEQEIEKIDKESGELITKQLGEWQDIGHNDKGLYKNPNTKKFTMTSPMVCTSCGEKIAPPDMPVMSGDTPEGPDLEGMAERERIIQEHVCPKCNEKAFGGMPR